MWCVVQVRTGSEEKICAQCGIMISNEIIEKCFVPYFEEKKKINGNWEKRQKVLFPGYIFIITQRPEELSDELKKINGLTNLLKADNEIVSLSEKEEKLLKRFGLDEKEVLEMSEGIIVGDQIIINEGPLIGMEGSIKKINRHKRRCWIEVDMFGRRQDIEVGLEILEKLTEDYNQK